MREKLFIITCFHFICLNLMFSTPYARLESDTLYIGNDLIERKFLWNGGALITHSIIDKISRNALFNSAKQPDFVVLKNDYKPTMGTFSSHAVKENAIHPGYLEVVVNYTLDKLNIKRVYRVYAHTPAIACDTYLKGEVDGLLGGKTESLSDKKNIEFVEDMNIKSEMAILDQLSLQGKHWHVKTVDFSDNTDWNNNLVFEKNVITYRNNSYTGNLLFARNAEKNQGFFFLKEAPCSNVQLAYGGNDFITEFGHIAVTGLGLLESDLRKEDWVKAYGCVLGVSDGSELSQLTALRSYQKNIRKLVAGRDEMIMMNTWGDRSQDSKVNEKFSLIEVERAAKLGVTHFQIDDGWQVGKSPNSAIAKGTFKNIWDNPNYWDPDPEKYPRGLHPIVKRGKELGVEICLWFNPSIQNDYADWEKDVDAMVKLYKEYGIRTFKIDGLSIPTKQSEINLRKLFDRVLEATDHNVVFNLDATAGRRGGYFMFNEYGNIFLENRYTDWQNYYPYHTLRNLWMLSKYVPAEKLQVEFLNKWRNTEKYGDDPFAPSNYSFEYLFSITMVAQPLAWFEGSSLPQEALGLNKLIGAYKDIQYDFHSGTILPIGEEPSGRSWTGFQSLTKKGEGYLLVFREDNLNSKGYLKTWFEEGDEVHCTPVFGKENQEIFSVKPGGFLEVDLPRENSFVLYKYRIIKR